MAATLQVIFSTPWTFLGTLVLVALLRGALKGVVRINIIARDNS